VSVTVFGPVKASEPADGTHLIAFALVSSVQIGAHDVVTQELVTVAVLGVPEVRATVPLHPFAKILPAAIAISPVELRAGAVYALVVCPISSTVARPLPLTPVASDVDVLVLSTSQVTIPACGPHVTVLKFDELSVALPVLVVPAEDAAVMPPAASRPTQK
jgi:hypothetical protein